MSDEKVRDEVYKTMLKLVKKDCVGESDLEKITAQW